MRARMIWVQIKTSSEIVSDMKYYISETKLADIVFYQKCFSQKEFCRGYDVFIPKNELSATIREIALAPYRDVKRYVLHYDGELISFCHFLSVGKGANVSGGILPEYFNSGKGIIAGVIFYDYYLCKYHPDFLVVEIQRENVRSQRMHRALGFEVFEVSDKVGMKLFRKNFPNKLVNHFLHKIKYEIR